MNKLEMTETIIAAKGKSGLGWEEIAAQVGLAPVFLTSACLGMNEDKIPKGEYCVSTSNRNFEGRQGKGGRTHLVSPAVAAATAVRGTLASPADLDS